MAVMVTATIQEGERAAGATLLVSPEDAARLGLADGQTVTLEVSPTATGRPWEGIVVSDKDFAAMKREVQDLMDRGVDGGVSPTLERLIAEAEAEGHVARTYRE